MLSYYPAIFSVPEKRVFSALDQDRGEISKSPETREKGGWGRGTDQLSIYGEPVESAGSVLWVRGSVFLARTPDVG